MPPSFPTRRSSDLSANDASKRVQRMSGENVGLVEQHDPLSTRGEQSLVDDIDVRIRLDDAERFGGWGVHWSRAIRFFTMSRSEEHTSELQSLRQLVCHPLSLHDALPI